MTLRVGILTVSDRSASGQRPDTSGPTLKEKILSLEWLVSEMGLVPDELAAIQVILAKWADERALDVILTTGGTGFAPRDVTPEATQAIIERPAPGLSEAMRAASFQITPHAMLSRSVAGIRGRTLIVNLPGSPRAALENLDVILPVLPHAIQLLREDQAAEASH